MPPDASPKPVMDVTPPRPGTPVAPPAAPVPPQPAMPAAMPPAPAVPKPDPASVQQLTVHEPPKMSGDPMPAAKAMDPSTPKEPAHHDAKAALPPMPAEKPAKPSSAKSGSHLQAPPLPVGAITATVIIMVVLAALTVVAFVSSK